MTPDVCQGCSTPIPPSRGGQVRKWCSERCRKRTLYSGVCEDCGASTYNGEGTPPKHCSHCNGRRGAERERLRHAAHRAEVERLWAEGLTSREIGERMGWGEKSAPYQITNLRNRGYNLPHRRTPEQLARILVGSDERMALAREALRRSRAAA